MAKTSRIAVATLARIPRREKPIPSGAAMKTTTRQLHGSASRYCRWVAKRREQDRREIGIEMQVVTQLRHAERIGVHIRARQTERRFAPVFEGDGVEELRLLDVSGCVVIDNFPVLQLPRFCFRMIGGVISEIIARDVILFVLLQDLHAVEFIFARPKD